MMWLVFYLVAHIKVNVGKTKKDDVMDENSRKENEKKPKYCSMVKCECKACLQITLDKWSRKWTVSMVIDYHNHKLVSPIKKMKMKSNRHMPKVDKNLAQAFQKENLEIRKVPSIFGGEYIGFDNKDCWGM